MDNPEKLVPWGTQDTGRRQTNYKNKTQKKKDQQHGSHQKSGVNPGAREKHT